MSVEEAFNFLAAIVAIQGRMHEVAFGFGRNLTVKVVSVGDHMFMTVQIQIKFELLKQGEVVGYNVGKIWVPFTPNRVVQSGGFPDNTLVV